MTINENGRLPERSLGDKLTGEVVRVLGTIEARKFEDGANIVQIKNAFPHITDRDLDRVTGKSKRSGNNTAALPAKTVITLAIAAWNRTDVGKPHYEKAFKKALKDAAAIREADKKKAEEALKQNGTNGRHGQQIRRQPMIIR